MQGSKKRYVFNKKEQKAKGERLVDESREMEKNRKAVTYCMTTQRTKQKDRVQGMQRGRRKGKGSRV